MKTLLIILSLLAHADTETEIIAGLQDAKEKFESAYLNCGSYPKPGLVRKIKRDPVAWKAFEAYVLSNPNSKFMQVADRVYLEAGIDQARELPFMVAILEIPDHSWARIVPGRLTGYTRDELLPYETRLKKAYPHSAGHNRSALLVLLAERKLSPELVQKETEKIILEGPESPHYQSALEAASQGTGLTPQALESLKKRISNSMSHTTQWEAYALGANARSSTDLVVLSFELQKSTEPLIQAAAARGLGMAGEKSLRYLQTIHRESIDYENQHFNVRRHSNWALLQIAPESTDVQNAVRRAIQEDPHLMVRVAVYRDYAGWADPTNKKHLHFLEDVWAREPNPSAQRQMEVTLREFKEKSQN